MTKISLTRLVVTLAITVVAVSLAIGYQAYRSSRDTLLQHVYASNMELARTFRDYVAATQNVSNSAVTLENLRHLWHNIEKKYNGGFLCVIDRKGTLTLHTATPHREGVDVGNSTVHPKNPVTLKSLVLNKVDHVGPYLSSAGVDQVAAFSYVPALDSVVSVHVPFQEIEHRINDTMLPWLISLVIIGAVILPISLWYLHRVNARSQQALAHSNDALRSEIQHRQGVEQELQLHKLKLEELVSRRTEELQRSNNELEAFSYSVSHDLRSPLRGIDGYSLALLEEYESVLDKNGKHYLQRVRAGVQRLGTLIDELLKLSHMTRMDLRKQTVDLTRLSQEVFSELRGDFPDRSIQLQVQENLCTNCDPNLIRVVLDNLLNNAIKYSAAVTAAEIEVGCIDERKPTIYYVKDNGVGFDMKHANKIFDPFHRLHNDQEFPGNGIGLATVERVIHRHGGSIWVDSKPNRGATFYFTLQAAKHAAEAPCVNTNPAAAQHPHTSQIVVGAN